MSVLSYLFQKVVRSLKLQQQIISCLLDVSYNKQISFSYSNTLIILSVSLKRRIPEFIRSSFTHVITTGDRKNVPSNNFDSNTLCNEVWCFSRYLKHLSVCSKIMTNPSGIIQPKLVAVTFRCLNLKKITLTDG